MLDGWMVGWMAGWLAGWLDGWMDGWMDDTETTVGYQRRGIKGRNKLYPQTLHSESLNSWTPSERGLVGRRKHYHLIFGDLKRPIQRATREDWEEENGINRFSASIEHPLWAKSLG